MLWMKLQILVTLRSFHNLGVRKWYEELPQRTIYESIKHINLKCFF